MTSQQGPTTVQTVAIYLMENGVQTYAWGTTDQIARITGRPNPDGRPMAELWMGSHPRLPSTVVLRDDRRLSLESMIEAHSDYCLGPGVIKRFGSRLPFLFKVLSAAQGLSIQVHPNLAQAKEGFAGEEAAGVPLEAPHRNYKDQSHKPEVLLAITPFWALSGFRAVEDIAADLSLLSEPELRDLLCADGLEAFYRKTMSVDLRTVEALIEKAERIDAYRPSRFDWIVELARQFPQDRGVLAPLYLNCVELNPGEALFLESGLLHAYLRGTGIELMANSDNVLRGGCTVKHVDLPELLSIVRFETTRDPRFSGAVENLACGRCRAFCPPVEEFALREIEADGECMLPSFDGPAIVFCLGGSVECSVDGGLRAPREVPGFERLTLQHGQSVFVAGAVDSLRVEGAATLYLATVGNVA